MKELFKHVRDALKDRQPWEDRQRIFYMMRHHGVRRRNKPAANSADLHCKLLDTTIEKTKPFYHQQGFSSERLAQFVSLRRDQAKMAEAAAVYLDYHLREETNFEQEYLAATDAMLLGGRGILKCGWDEKRKRIRYECIDPLLLVVHQRANTLEESDWFCEVQVLSKAQYLRDPRFQHKDADFVAKITGGVKESGAYQQAIEKQTREGFTHSKNEDEIIVWNYWHNTGDGWQVHTVSPAYEETPLRDPFMWPLRLRGDVILPYTSLVSEVKDKGWYSPRGIADRIGAIENYINKVWNTKSDALEYATRPTFTADGPIGNIGTIRLMQGEVLPGNLKPLQMPTPPMDLDMEMQNSRQLAEQNVMVPDFGIGGSQGGKDSRTATEVGFIQNLTGTGIELKGRVFRLGLRDTYRVSWALILHNRSSQDELIAFTSKEASVLPEQALHDSYLITPDGAPDAWNKNARLQRAVARFREFKGDPSIDQDNLRRELINADDPRLTDRLLIPSNMKAASEAEDEAMEIAIMMDGFPAAARPDEDHVVRIQTIVGKLEQLNATQTPVNPIAMQRLSEHLAQHIQFLRAQNPDAAKQVMAILSQVMAGAAGAMPGAPAPTPLPAQPPGNSIGYPSPEPQEGVL